MKFNIIYALLLTQVFVVYGKRGKTHVRPEPRPTEAPEIELEPEPEIEPPPEYKPPERPYLRPTTTRKPRPEPEAEDDDDFWAPIPTPKPETEFWVPIKPSAEPEYWVTVTTRRPHGRPEPEMTHRPEPETIRTTRKPRPEPESEYTRPEPTRPKPRPEPEITVKPKPRPEPEITHRPRPELKPEPERITTTTRKPRPEAEPSRKPYPEPTPEEPIYSPYPIEEPPPACQSIRCRTGYRCDCINACPATCLMPDRKPCPTFICKTGCVCDKGYVLNETDSCVLAQSCPKPEPIRPVCNKKCANGKQCICENPCPPTCADPDPKPCPTLRCDADCYTVCRKGYVFDRIGGDCMPLEYCPNRQCIRQPFNNHENEVYYECSTRQCNRTCLNPNIKCAEQCIKPGNMDCRPGYLRDVRNGVCVPYYQCNQPLTCERKDEAFFECDTRMCQRTCQRPEPTCPAVCRQPGNCDCRPGLVRDLRNCRCVDKNESTCLAQRLSDD